MSGQLVGLRGCAVIVQLSVAGFGLWVVELLLRRWLFRVGSNSLGLGLVICGRHVDLVVVHNTEIKGRVEVRTTKEVQGGMRVSLNAAIRRALLGETDLSETF